MKYYYYSKEKNLLPVVGYNRVKDEIYESAEECMQQAAVKYRQDLNVNEGYIYTLVQQQATGENINHRYKSSLPLQVVSVAKACEFYT